MMAVDWKPGDLALCVRHDPRGDVRKGAFYTVEGVTVGTEGRCAGVLGLYLRGVLASGTQDGWFAAFGFKKIRPHTPDAEDAETIRLLTGNSIRERVS